MKSAARRQQPGLRLPPFGRELLELRRQGLVPARGRVFVALDSWDHGRAFARVVVPQDLDPAQLEFSFVAGLDAIVYWCPGATSLARRDATIRAVLAKAPRSLQVLVDADPAEILFVKLTSGEVAMPEFAT